MPQCEKRNIHPPIVSIITQILSSVYILWVNRDKSGDRCKKATRGDEGEICHESK